MKLLVFFIMVSTLNLRSLVHIIGDSHGFYCFMDPMITDTIDKEYNNKIFLRASDHFIPFKVSWLGPSTLYKIGKHLDALSTRPHFLEELNDGDVCIFSFGEIDCRCHIQKQLLINKEKTQESIIDDLVSRYKKELRKFSQKYNNLNLKLAILGLVPPMVAKDTMPVNGEFSDRLNTVLLLNKKLNEMALSEGYYFLDIYPLYAAQDGSLPLHLSDGFNHISVFYNDRIWNLMMNIIFAV